MPARCRKSASVSPPMPAPTIATRSARMGLGFLEQLQAARGAGAARHVLNDGGGDDLAVLGGHELHGAGAIVEAVVARVLRRGDRRDPLVRNGAVGLRLAQAGPTV